jgi:FtsZ-binding cell division protein ZapB
MPYQKPSVEDAPESPVIPYNPLPDEAHELVGDHPEPAVEGEAAPAELPAWNTPVPVELPAWPASPRIPPVAFPAPPPSPDDPVPGQEGAQVIIHLPNQDVLVVEGLGQHTIDLQIGAGENRDEHHRQVGDLHMALDNLQNDHRVLQDNFQEVQGENARLRAENERLRVERDRARDALVGVLQPFGGRPMF